MKTKIKFAIVGLVLFLGLSAGIGLWLLVPTSVPQVAITKYVFSKGHFIEAFNLDIEETMTFDGTYGQLFMVKGYTKDGYGYPYFWLKHSDGNYYVDGVGTFP